MGRADCAGRRHQLFALQSRHHCQRCRRSGNRAVLSPALSGAASVFAVAGLVYWAGPQVKLLIDRYFAECGFVVLLAGGFILLARAGNGRARCNIGLCAHGRQRAGHWLGDHYRRFGHAAYCRVDTVIYARNKMALLCGIAMTAFALFSQAVANCRARADGARRHDISGCAPRLYHAGVEYGFWPGSRARRNKVLTR